MQELVNQLGDIKSSLGVFVPEIYLIGGLIFTLVIGLIAKNKLFVHALALITALWVLVQVGMQNPEAGYFFNKMLLINSGTILLKTLVDLAGIGVLLLAINRPSRHYQLEYIIGFLVMILGAHLLVMSSHFLMVWLSVELLSITAYMLSNYQFRAAGHEAGIKYLLFGGVSSALMLYGISLVYLETGTLSFVSPEFLHGMLEANPLLLVTSALFILTGVFFKISAFPMHIWVPDVYQESPTSTIALFATIPKIAGFGLLIKWLLVFQLFGQAPVSWQEILAVLAMATLITGNFAALWQKNVKRMLGYSAIAHSGFLMIPILVLQPAALEAFLFYGFIYILVTVGMFGLIQLMERRGIRTIEDYSGQFYPHPVEGVIMLILFIAFTGLPPTAGFTAKLFVFSSLWTALENSSNILTLLMVVGVLNAAIALFYYLRVPYFMIFKSKSIPAAYDKIFTIENFLALFMVILILLFFIRPDILMNYFNNANFAF